MESSSPIQIFNKIRLIHAIIVIPMVLFAGVVYYLNGSGTKELADDMMLFTYLPIGFMIVAILVGRQLYFGHIKKAKGKPFTQRLNGMLVATLLRDAIFEAAGLLAAISSFMTGNNTLLLLVPIIVLQFYVNRPTILRVTDELEVTKEELEGLK